MIKTLKIFYNFLFNYKKRFNFFIFVLLFTTIIGNTTPYISKLLIDAIPSLNYSLLFKLTSLFIGVRVAVNFLRAFGRYLGDKVLFPASRDARIKIFKKVQDLDFAFHVNKSTGKLISIFKRGDRGFFHLFDSIHHDILEVLISLFVSLFFLTQITPVISLLMVFTFLVNLFIGWRLIGLNIEKRRVFNRSEDKVSGIITDNLLNFETVKFFAQEKKEGIRLRQEFKDWLDKFWQYANSFRLMNIVSGTLSNLGILGILWIVIQKLQSGLISIGDLVMVISLTTNFYYEFFNLMRQVRSIAKHYTDIESYFSILGSEILVKDPKKPVELKNIKGRIDFDNVSFSYKDGKQNVLKKMDLLIEPGESVAFVGYSGVGKTTIMKLLLRFYDVDDGKILIDGVDIRKLTKSQLRSSIGIVPQNPILFNNTIRFNLVYGNPSVTEEEIERAVKIANLYDFINNLSEKYETKVGERGIKLSGGQKQRLAIARMILANPKIIIFDEATSSLDSESESLIQESLWEVAENRTTLIIAHRFSTIAGADKIVVIEKGNIVEMGSHEKLIEKKGIYHYLWKLQTQKKKTL